MPVNASTEARGTAAGVDRARLLDTMVALVREAHAEIMAVYARPFETQLKEDRSPLTEADLASHRVLTRGLAQFPLALPVISEEGGLPDAAERAAWPAYWLIDPLDGTKEFLARNGEFTVNIALVRDGEPVWGVVYAPLPGLMYWGGKGAGSFRCEGDRVEPIRVRPAIAPGGRYRVVASKSHLNLETSRFIEALGGAELVQAGSSLKFCRIAEGAADVYPRLAPTCEWDTAAAQAVLEGAGGHVYDMAGARLRYGKPDILNPHFVASSVPLAVLGR
jgi:3'(2'), 5'-bisphosphate nucleotidase